MERPVIASVDGSDRDGRAVAVARAIATIAEAELHVVRIIEADGKRQHAEPVLDVTVPGEPDVTVDVIEASDAAAAIMEYAVQRDAQLLTMATRAKGAVGRAMAGSVADRVARESPVPVVMVPPGADFMSGRDVQITRLLVPQDGSSLAFRCLEFLIALPHADELDYVLIEVLSSEDDRRAVEVRMKTTAAWLRSRGAKSVETIIVDPGDASAAILGAVREALPELIAMSTRGASGLERLILGSVAEAVVRESELPVLLLTPKVLANSHLHPLNA
jgi:nucleotide-binding universal stress UspA family protein